MRDHGGNIDEAIAAFGGEAERWVDLSTGINRVPYPVPELPSGAWTDLPTRAEMAQVAAVAAEAYGTQARVLPVAGAQAAIQLIPRLAAPGVAAVLGPTYNEHTAALRLAGWTVRDVDQLAEMAGVDLAVVVNPNNPDGRVFSSDVLLDLTQKVGRLVVDESFADMTPGSSLAPVAGQHGLLILRSFGKFYGLAGVRLGFVIGADNVLAELAAMAGPWPVSGMALGIGRAALADRRWQAETRVRLDREAGQLDALAAAAGWSLVGGTSLFRTYATPSAFDARNQLARHLIWSRIFPYSAAWLRLGLPGSVAEWQRLEAALAETNAI